MSHAIQPALSQSSVKPAVSNQSLIPLPLDLLLPHPLPTPKFQLGQFVYWAHVPSHDYGCIIGVVYTSEASTQATGYHYAIQLDPGSPSYADGTRSDWAFEEDLELLPPNSPTNGHQEG